jgi:prephenate dehydrogenase
MAQLQRCAVIGLGLIGGSFAAALKSYGVATCVVGIDSNTEALREALTYGYIDEIGDIHDASLASCEVVFVATPVRSMPTIFTKLNEVLPSTALVIDFGSVKGELSYALNAAISFRYLPAHPIAGGERSGIHAAQSTLFQGKKFIICPFHRETYSADVALMEQIIQVIGGQSEVMDISEHDAIFAAVSHVPHVVAYALVNSLRTMESRSGIELGRYPGAGFRDFTRIASSDEVMWSDIALTNRTEILHALDAFEETLCGIRQAITSNDEEYLLATFRHAREYRDKIVMNLAERQKTTV